MKRLMALCMALIFGLSLLASGCEDTNTPAPPLPKKDTGVSQKDGK